MFFFRFGLESVTEDFPRNIDDSAHTPRVLRCWGSDTLSQSDFEGFFDPRVSVGKLEHGHKSARRGEVPVEILVAFGVAESSMRERIHGGLLDNRCQV